MIKHLSIILTLLFVSIEFTPLHAQKGISDDEVKAFVQVFFESKKNDASVLPKVTTLLERYSISPERYRVLFNSSLLGVQTSPTKNEKEFMLAVKTMNDSYEGYKLSPNLFFKYKISIEKYSEILTKYRSDIAFQRSLKPFFDQYIKYRK